MKCSVEKFRGLRFGVFEVDLLRQELRKHGIKLKLSTQPFQALVQLLEANGEVVTREQMRNALWPDQQWGDHDQRLNNVINKIREALCDSADAPHLLETLPRVGYRFLASIEYIPETAAEDSEVESIVVEPLVPLATPGVRRWRLVPALVVLVTVLAAAAFEYRRFTDRAPVYGSFVSTPLTTFVGSELYPGFSPNGQNVVFAANGEAESSLHIHVVSTTGGGTRRITDGESNDFAPVWANDGSQIAFLRESGDGLAEVWLIRLDGTNARRLAEVRRTDSDHPLSWTQDSRWLVVAAASASGGPSALYLMSTITGEQRQITSGPIRFGGDLSPAISPDGRRLAFTRATGFSWRDIFVVTLSSDLLPIQEPIRLTDLKQIVDAVTWTPDGRSLIFSAANTGAGARHLFSVDVDRSSPAKSLVETGIEGMHPSVSPDGHKLVYASKNLEQSSIWRLDLQGSKGPQRLISSTRRDYTVDTSPDGQRLVFSSVRSGPSEIWTSKKDGSDLKRITSLGASTPRWSPEGGRIVFESNAKGQPDIYVFESATGLIRQVSTEPGRNLRPSWSRDGKSIYFSSNSTGRSQIYKVPAEGGTPVQITRFGGTYAIEAFNGKTLYYTAASRPSAIWKTTTQGGDETPVVPNVVGSAIAMARDGLYYLSSATSTGAQLNFYDFRAQASRRLATIDRPVHHFLSSPPDGKSVLYTQVDRQESDLILVNAFR